MTTMACNKKWSGLFSVGDDFDDDDLLEADWTHSSEDRSAATTSGPLQESATFPTHSAEQASFGPPVSSRDSSSEPSSLASLRLPELGAVKSLRSLSHPSTTPSVSVLHKPTSCLQPPSGSSSAVSSLQFLSSQSNPPPSVYTVLPQDDFDEWDVDLEELDDRLFQKAFGQRSAVAADNDGVSPAKCMRSSFLIKDPPVVSSLRGFCSSASPSRPSHSAIQSPCPSTFAPRAPPQSSCQPFGRRAAVCRFTSPGPVKTTPELQRGVTTPRAQQRCPEPLFQAISPAPSQPRTPRPLHTPVLTNHLVQLVSAANKTPQRPRRDMARSKTRRFPGPAGALPQQTSGRNLDDIVVTVPQMPAHGAVARLQNEAPSSQGSEEEEFNGGPWAAMKVEMGLDERNPSCFLHSYSVVMVLRKAALRQLVKNKVPNMAVVLKSILHTHADAKAVFRDPTGEMHGTVHRRLLEDRQGELKPGVVLLLKQVGVFSPSHRNHYLNVTSNNLLRIYSSDGAPHASSQLSQAALQCESSRPVVGPVCQMELRYDDDDEEEEEQEAQSVNLTNPAVPVAGVIQPSELGASEDVIWGADDLDELLGELPV